MWLLFGVIFIFLLVIFPHFRNIVANIYLALWYAPQDIYKYIKFKRWRECKTFGTIDMYCSDTSKVFGNGKTLSGVYKVRQIFKMYDGKYIYDFESGQWIRQTIHILSNVHFTDIPYVHLNYASQIVDYHTLMNKGDVLIVYIDEAGVIFNSRNFKENIGQDLLNSMLTCRKKKFGMIFTAQRFNQVDALIRQLTSRVFMADKLWRSVVLKEFTGYDMEYCVNTDYLKYKIVSYFATNKLFDSYDTNQGVEDIKRKMKNGEMLTDKEILEAQGNSPEGILNVKSANRKLKKVVKRG